MHIHTHMNRDTFEHHTDQLNNFKNNLCVCSQRIRFGSPFSPVNFLRSSSRAPGHRACQQGPLPTEPSCHLAFSRPMSFLLVPLRKTLLGLGWFDLVSLSNVDWPYKGGFGDSAYTLKTPSDNALGLFVCFSTKQSKEVKMEKECTVISHSWGSRFSLGIPASVWRTSC